MRRPLVYTTIALGISIALLKPWSVGRTAQGPPPPQISEAATRINKDLDLTFKTQGLIVSPEARAVITQEIVGREVSKGKPPTEIKLSPGEAATLGTQLAGRSGGAAVDAQSARLTLAEQKLPTISANAAADIPTEAASAHVTLPTDTQDAIKKDILQYSTAMARSGLSIDQITSTNKQYLDEVYRLAGFGKTLELDQYATIKGKIFRPVVKLNIVTVPPGATVQVSAGGTNAPIGTTNITEKPFDPSKKYLFLFSLTGYQDSKREYEVTPFPPTQTLNEVMVKK
jgi:hypothetical protein